MVNLIPESEHEDMLLALVEEIIDMINEESPDPIKLEEKEELLLRSRIADFDWLFNIAEVYFNNNNYERAIDFFENGIAQAEKSYILPRYYNILGVCYHRKENFEDAIRVFELAVRASNNDKDTYTYLCNAGHGYLLLSFRLKDEEESINKLKKGIECLSQAIELAITGSFKVTLRSYNYRGRCYVALSDIEKDQNKKNQLLKHALEDFNQVIILDSKDKNNYWNRSRVYDRLSQEKECIEDLIQAEYLEHNDKYIKNLSILFEKNLDLISEAMEFYHKLALQIEGPSQLVELINKYHAKIEISKQIEAAAGKAPDENEK